jgi:RNA polymerase sigma factor (sigma-70 family)
VIVNGQARALIESMPNDIGTEAVGPLSFDEAFTLHHRAVFRTARAVVRDSALAEDVTQEVFLRLYRNLDATPGEDLLRAWLLRVTLNVARNIVRGQNRSMVRDHEYHKSSVDNGFAVEAPEEDYERRAAIDEARRALAKIKEPMRSCLLLKQQGLSYREIAHTLSLKETNIGSLVARGRKEFARVYGKIGGK